MCVELANKVAPAVTDPVVQVQLDMALAVLQTTAVRSGSELAWMQEERDAIEQAARQVLDALPDAAPLPDALKAYTDGLTEQPRTSTTPRPTTPGRARCCRAPSRPPTSRAMPSTSPPSGA